MSQPITHIVDHEAQAVARLPQQYVGKPNISAMATIFGDRYQTVEDVFWDMYSNGSLANAHDTMLDQIGEIVGQPRNGMADPLYRIRIAARIGQNVSKGTAEDVIKIFKILMQADRVYYRPDYPAGFILTAIGGTPLGSMSDIKNAMNSSRMGGVSINLYTTTASVAFSFSDDPDPAGQGFGTVADSTVGGSFATIL